MNHPVAPRASDDALSFLAGPSELAALMRAHDWSRTPLPAPQEWPQSLRAIVGLMLNSRYPMFLAWGPELAFLYNDGYRPIFGDKHPEALGQPFPVVWREIWPDLQVLVDRALAGEPTWSENLLLYMHRHGFPEEVYFTFSYSPVRGDDGAIAGMFCACTETTAEVLGERRLATLRDVHAVGPAVDNVLDACVRVGEVLERNPRDLPLAWLYLIEEDGRASLCSGFGLGAHADRAPRQLCIDADAPEGWPDAARIKPVRHIRRDVRGSADDSPAGATPVGATAVLPLHWTARDQPDALLIIGASAHLPFDEHYERFVDLLASAVSTVIGKAYASAIRDQAEQRLRASETRYRAIFEHPSECIVVLEAQREQDGRIRDWRYVDANGNALELLGKTREALIGRPLSQVVPERSTRLAQVCAETLRSRAPVQYEAAFGPIDFLITVFPMTRDCVVCASVDITARKRMEEALRESEIRFRTMADNAPVMVWVTDADGSCSYLSRSWCLFTGRTLEDGLGFGWLETVHAEDRPGAEAAFTQANERREPFKIEYRVRRHDGVYVYAIDAATPRFGLSGEFLGYIGSVLDISERRKLELQREQLLEAERAARSAAEAANRMKDEFLATISHELRTPLSNVISWARVLERKYPGNDEHVRRGLSIITANASAQAQLISDLLDMNRIASGKLTLELQPLDVCELLENVVAAHRPQAETSGVTLHFEPVDCPIEILGDAARLQQIINNLLSNALKFTPRGGDVSVQITDEGASCRVDVRDTGIGIAADMLPRIFERFRQADSSTSRRYGGLGLGLAIVRQLAEMHGGEVRAASEGPGRGAQFTLRLPKVSNFESARTVSKAPDVGQSVDYFEPESLRGLRVLVVEDDAGMLEHLERTLLEQGAEVVTARSALAALRLATQETFVVLVSDIGLPDVDGYELVRRLREEHGISATRLPAVAVTAFTRGEDHARALQAGFQAHLTKPFEVAQLVATIRRVANEGPGVVAGVVIGR